MHVKEVQTSDGTYAVNAEGILGIARGKYTVWRGTLPGEFVLATLIWDRDGLRRDVTTRLWVERELREVEMALDSQEASCNEDVLRAVVALCDDALGDYVGVTWPYVPEALRGYRDIRFIAAEALSED